MWIFGRHRHLSHGRLSDYWRDRLSREEKARIEGAIAECALCREELESLGETRSLLQALPNLEPSRSFVMAAAPVAASGVALAPALPFVFRAPSWAYAGAASLAGLALVLILVTEGGGLWSHPGKESYQESVTMASPAADVAPVARAPAEAPVPAAAQAQVAPIPASAQAMPAAKAAPGHVAPESAEMKEVPVSKGVEVEVERSISAPADLSVAPTEPTPLPAAMALSEPVPAASPTAMPSAMMESSAQSAEPASVETPTQSASDAEVTAMAKTEATGSPPGVAGGAQRTADTTAPTSSPGEAGAQGAVGPQGPQGPADQASGDDAKGAAGPSGPAGEAGPQGTTVPPGPAGGYANGSFNTPAPDLVGDQTIAGAADQEATATGVPSPTKVQGTGYADRDASPTATVQQDFVETEAVKESVQAKESMPEPTQEPQGSASELGESAEVQDKPATDVSGQAGLATAEAPPTSMDGVEAEATGAIAKGSEVDSKAAAPSAIESATSSGAEDSAAAGIDATARDSSRPPHSAEPSAKIVKPTVLEGGQSPEEGETPGVASEPDRATDDKSEESSRETTWVTIAAAAAIAIALAIALAYRLVRARRSTN